LIHSPDKRHPAPSAIERGDIEAEHPLANGPWVINRPAFEMEEAVRFPVASATPKLRVRVYDQDVIDFSTI
jgi:hypothetical protein